MIKILILKKKCPTMVEIYDLQLQALHMYVHTYVCKYIHVRYKATIESRGRVISPASRFVISIVIIFIKEVIK